MVGWIGNLGASRVDKDRYLSQLLVAPEWESLPLLNVFNACSSLIPSYLTKLPEATCEIQGQTQSKV